MPASWFTVLMLAASVVYHLSWLAILANIPHRAVPAGLYSVLHFTLMFVLPGVLVLAAGYRMGVLQNANAVIRFAGLSLLGVVIPITAAQLLMIYACLLFGACI